MSTGLKGQKRKSADGASVQVTKKAKIQHSANKPAPLKSALKKPKVAIVESEKKAQPAKVVKTKKATATEEAAVVEEAHAKEMKPRANVVKKKAVSKQPPAEEKSTFKGFEDVGDAANGTELSEDQTAALLAGFSSSDGSDAEEDADGIALSKLPKAPLISAIQKEIAVTSSNDPETTPGIIYVGRIPHGFYEPQMRAYFSQFGEVTNLRLARNKKTGKPQHYAFLEFASASVAEIVAKTMDKYLMFGHILQVRTVPRESVGSNVWAGANKRVRVMPRNKIEGGRLKRGLVREGWEKRVEKENKRRVGKAAKLKEMGYEFNMQEVTSVDAVPVKPVTVDIEASKESDVQKLVEDAAAPEDAGDDEVIDVQDTITTKPGSVEITEMVKTKKRSSAEGVKKIKKAKRVKTAA